MTTLTDIESMLEEIRERAEVLAQAVESMDKCPADECKTVTCGCQTVAPIIENKALFVTRLNQALIECGAGRYDFLISAPLQYQKRRIADADGYIKAVDEVVIQNGKCTSVWGDSLTAMMSDIYKGIFS